jgi:hypothetical protein
MSVKCETCRRAIEYRPTRSAWVHAAPGADHPPIPPRDVSSTFGRRS